MNLSECKTATQLQLYAVTMLKQIANEIAEKGNSFERLDFELSYIMHLIAKIKDHKNKL